MSVNLAPGPFGAGYQAFNANGQILALGLLYTYAAGGTTPTATYTTSVGNVQNANPIVLGVDGRPPQEIWLTGGTSYKFFLTDSLGNTIGTWDNLTGVNDISVGNIGWAVAAGTVDAITATYTPANTSLTDGLVLNFRASGANTVTTPSFSPDGLTPHTITKNGGQALSVSEIAANLAEITVRYNLANTRWEMVNEKPSFFLFATTFDMSLATNTNKTISTCPFRPRYMELYGAFPAASQAAFWGKSDGTTEYCNYSNSGVTPGDTINEASLGLAVLTGAINQRFTLVGAGFTANGVVIKNTKTGAAAGTFNLTGTLYR